MSDAAWTRSVQDGIPTQSMGTSGRGETTYSGIDGCRGSRTRRTAVVGDSLKSAWLLSRKLKIEESGRRLIFPKRELSGRIPPAGPRRPVAARYQPHGWHRPRRKAMEE